MFSTHYQSTWERIAGLRQQRTGALDGLRPQVASDFLPLLWKREFDTGGALDRAILARSAALESALYGDRVFAWSEPQN